MGGGIVGEFLSKGPLPYTFNFILKRRYLKGQFNRFKPQDSTEKFNIFLLNGEVLYLILTKTFEITTVYLKTKLILRKTTFSLLKFRIKYWLKKNLVNHFLTNAGQLFPAGSL